ncbi:MAG: hypothetical protein KUG78_08360 [Kangiellaceae bacterium]|nr:hypothetical protein [Kangiellaceae bacterium]
MSGFYDVNHLHIFTDGSVNSKLKVGYGSYLVVSDLGKPINALQDTVKVKRFEQTNSTKLELQTVLWVLGEISLAEGKDVSIRIYTDCQNIIGLPNRRARLEENNYYSSKNKRLNNYELYQEFYQFISDLDCEFIKVAGHQKSSEKDRIDKLFALVDRASRRALREEF